MTHSIRNMVNRGNSLTVQRLRLHASTARGPVSICGQGTKIPQASWCGQGGKKKKKEIWSIIL